MSTVQGGGMMVTDGLVLCLDAANSRSYPTTGTTWTDLSKCNNNSTLINGPTFNSSNGGSIVFDGFNDYTSIPYSTSISSTLVTVSLWIRFGNFLSLDKVLFSKGAGLGVREYWFYENNGVQFVYGGVSPQISSSVLTNRWVNIVGIQSSTSSSIYLNGLLFGSTNGIGAINNIQGIGINSYSDGSFPSSPKRIAIVKVYNRVLSSTEVLQNYNALKSRFGL